MTEKRTRQWLSQDFSFWGIHLTQTIYLPNRTFALAVLSLWGTMHDNFRSINPFTPSWVMGTPLAPADAHFLFWITPSNEPIFNQESPHSRSHRPLSGRCFAYFSFQFRSAFAPRYRIWFDQFHCLTFSRKKINIFLTLNFDPWPRPTKLTLIGEGWTVVPTI